MACAFLLEAIVRSHTNTIGASFEYTGITVGDRNERQRDKWTNYSAGMTEDAHEIINDLARMCAEPHFTGEALAVP
jgi:hypothetical protein